MHDIVYSSYRFLMHLVHYSRDMTEYMHLIQQMKKEVLRLSTSTPVAASGYLTLSSINIQSLSYIIWFHDQTSIH